MAEQEKKAEESPTLAEETPKGTPKESPATDDTTALLAELEKAGVSNAEQLQGKLIASSQAGNLANQLGAIRQENAELKAMMENSGQQKMMPEESFASEETDLTKIMEGSVEKVLDRREKRQREINTQINQATSAMWGKIYNHPKYGIVKEVWEKKFENPNFSMQIQQGLLNPLEEFHNTLNGYWEGIAKRSVETIKTLQGKGDVTIPHVEGEGQVSAPATEAEKSAQQEKMTNFKEKVDKGGKLTEEEEMDALLGSLTKKP